MPLLISNGFSMYKVMHSYIQITLSHYKIKFNINSITNFAYLKQLVIRLLFETKLIHNNIHRKFKIFSSVLQCEYFSIPRRI